MRRTITCATVLVSVAGCAAAPSGVGRPAVSTSATRLASTITLGPNGYGRLELGMSRDAAMRTGLLTPVKVPDPGCSGHDLVDFPTPADSASVYVSDRMGVAAIFASEGMATPEGVRLGSPLSAARAAYPALSDAANGSVTPVPGNPKAYYEIAADDRGQVIELVLAVTGQDCYG